MHFPLILAVAWLSPGSKRLLSTSRLIAMQAGEPGIRGLHLFQAAAGIPQSKAGRSIPKPARTLLAKVPYRPENTSDLPEGPFYPISPHIEEACKDLAYPGQLVLPEALLKEVFKRDAETRQEIRDLLEPDIFELVDSRIMLPEFSVNQRNNLYLLKDRFKENDIDIKSDRTTHS